MHHCRRCWKEFQCENDVRWHLAKECRNLTCLGCGRAFNKVGHLYRHMRLTKKRKKLNGVASCCPDWFETEEREKYKFVTRVCEKCQREFVSEDTFAKHVKRCSGWVCKRCGETFNKRGILITHVSYGCRRELPCPLCFKGYTNISNFRAHVKNCEEREKKAHNNFACRYCSRPFDGMTDLLTHWQTNGCEKRLLSERKSFASVKKEPTSAPKKKPTHEKSGIPCAMCNLLLKDKVSVRKHYFRCPVLKAKPVECFALCGLCRRAIPKALQRSHKEVCQALLRPVAKDECAFCGRTGLGSLLLDHLLHACPKFSLQLCQCRSCGMQFASRDDRQEHYVRQHKGRPQKRSKKRTEAPKLERRKKQRFSLRVNLKKEKEKRRKREQKEEAEKAKQQGVLHELRAALVAALRGYLSSSLRGLRRGAHFLHRLRSDFVFDMRQARLKAARQWSLRVALRPHRHLVCFACRRSFSNARVYEIHRLRHARMAPYSCRICHLEFCTCAEVRQHMQDRHRLRRSRKAAHCRSCGQDLPAGLQDKLRHFAACRSRQRCPAWFVTGVLGSRSSPQEPALDHLEDNLSEGSDLSIPFFSVEDLKVLPDLEKETKAALEWTCQRCGLAILSDEHLRTHLCISLMEPDTSNSQSLHTLPSHETSNSQSRLTLPMMTESNSQSLDTLPCYETSNSQSRHIPPTTDSCSQSLDSNLITESNSQSIDTSLSNKTSNPQRLLVCQSTESNSRSLDNFPNTESNSHSSDFLPTKKSESQEVKSENVEVPQFDVDLDADMTISLESLGSPIFDYLSCSNSPVKTAKWVCKDCSFPFNTRKLYREHRQKAHNGKRPPRKRKLAEEKTGAAPLVISVEDGPSMIISLEDEEEDEVRYVSTKRRRNSKSADLSSQLQNLKSEPQEFPVVKTEAVETTPKSVTDLDERSFSPQPDVKQEIPLLQETWNDGRIAKRSHESSSDDTMSSRSSLSDNCSRSSEPNTVVGSSLTSSSISEIEDHENFGNSSGMFVSLEDDEATRFSLFSANESREAVPNLCERQAKIEESLPLACATKREVSSPHDQESHHETEVTSQLSTDTAVKEYQSSRSSDSNDVDKENPEPVVNKQRSTSTRKPLQRLKEENSETVVAEQRLTSTSNHLKPTQKEVTDSLATKERLMSTMSRLESLQKEVPEQAVKKQRLESTSNALESSQKIVPEPVVTEKRLELISNCLKPSQKETSEPIGKKKQLKSTSNSLESSQKAISEHSSAVASNNIESLQKSSDKLPALDKQRLVPTYNCVDPAQKVCHYLSTHEKLNDPPSRLRRVLIDRLPEKQKHDQKSNRTDVRPDQPLVTQLAPKEGPPALLQDPEVKIDHRELPTWADASWNTSGSTEPKPARRKDKRGKGTWTCIVCDQSFVTRFRLKEHQHEVGHSSARSFRRSLNSWLCHLCTMRFPVRDELREHIKTCHSILPSEAEEPAKAEDLHEQHRLVCGFCEEASADLRGLRIHLQTSCARSPYVKHDIRCRACRQRFPAIYKLNLHARSSRCGPDAARVFSCPRCEQRFSRLDKLAAHMQKGCFRLFNCGACSRELPSHRSLMLHRQNCLIRACKACGRLCKDLEALEKHVLQEHPAQEPIFRCVFGCYRLFDSLRDLLRHQRSKAGCALSRHLCSRCSLGFASLEGFRNHLQACGQGRAVCPRCAFDFAAREDLEAHLQLCLHLCAGCGEELHDLSDPQLAAHIRSCYGALHIDPGLQLLPPRPPLAIPCPYCQRTVFSSEHARQRHINREHESEGCARSRPFLAVERRARCRHCHLDLPNRAALRSHVAEAHTHGSTLDNARPYRANEPKRASPKSSSGRDYWSEEDVICEYDITEGSSSVDTEDDVERSSDEMEDHSMLVTTTDALKR